MDMDEKNRLAETHLPHAIFELWLALSENARIVAFETLLSDDIPPGLLSNLTDPIRLACIVRSWVLEVMWRVSLQSSDPEAMSILAALRRSSRVESPPPPLAEIRGILDAVGIAGSVDLPVQERVKMLVKRWEGAKEEARVANAEAMAIRVSRLDRVEKPPSMLDG